jgi:hypothetical protein
MMKIAHEAPTSIFAAVQRMTDYDYALVHLFEENPMYYRMFKDAVINGREVILDNSIFELGTAFDSDLYYKWIEKLQPTYFIIPDVLEDTLGTLRSMDRWYSKYVTSPKIKSIGVIQGKTYKEIVECYKDIAPRVDKIAISFDYSYYIESTINLATINKYASYMFGRQKLLGEMLNDGVIDTNKPHHLLGCSLPQEFGAYKDFKWIDSVDTSNPVVHGLNGIAYRPYGLNDKVSTKLIDYMDAEVTDTQLAIIKDNITRFKRFCNG